jgi:hypothetical protein
VRGALSNERPYRVSCVSLESLTREDLLDVLEDARPAEAAIFASPQVSFPAIGTPEAAKAEGFASQRRAPGGFSLRAMVSTFTPNIQLQEPTRGSGVADFLYMRPAFKPWCPKAGIGSLPVGPFAVYATGPGLKEFQWPILELGIRCGAGMASTVPEKLGDSHECRFTIRCGPGSRDLAPANAAQPANAVPTSFRTANAPWVGCSISAGRYSPTCRNVGNYKTYIECKEAGLKVGWRDSEQAAAEGTTP